MNESLQTFQILDVKNYDNRCKQMKEVFGYQDIFEVIKNGVKVIESDETPAQKVAHKEEKTKYFKALYMIH